MATEEEKKRMADFQVSLNQKKAEKSKVNTEHIKRLEELSTLEEVLAYWSENCIDSSFFIGIFGEDVNYKVEQVYEDRDSRLKILEAEMKRIENKYLNELLYIHIKNRFDFRVRTDPNTYEIAKDKAIQEIEKLANLDGFFKTLKPQHRNKGFNAFEGGDGYEIAVMDLRKLSLSIENKIGFRHIYEGYLLARLKAKIMNPTDSPLAVNINSHNSPLTSALILKHLGIVEKIGKGIHLTNEKVIELLSATFGGVIKASSISSSYRDKEKSTPKARAKALKVLQSIGTTETIETFLGDWRRKE
jgi:hypothetical protein